VTVVIRPFSGTSRQVYLTLCFFGVITSLVIVVYKGDYTLIQFHSEDVKHVLIIVACIVYTARTLYTIHISNQELKQAKKEYLIKLDKYLKLRSERVDSALEFSSTMQADLDRMKAIFPQLTLEEQQMHTEIQLQLDKYRANIIKTHHIINL
jgi:hypothetical protein